MREDLRYALHDAAKTAGMGIAARCSQVAGDLALVRHALGQSVAVDPVVPASLLQHVADRCAGLWVDSEAGRQPLVGEAPIALPSLDVAERQHLASGRPLLRAVGASKLVMLLQLGTADRRICASIRAKWFWDPEELRVAGSDVAIFDGRWQPLFHTFRELPDMAPLQQAARKLQPTGTVAWTPASEPHVACVWRAFLRPQYGFELLVVQSRSEREALAVSTGFLWWFIGAAATTLCFVLLASLVQMRRTLGPIVSLGAATRRLAAGDLGARVTIGSRDEFGELGGAFNHMASQLQENVRRREQTERELTASRDAALAAVRAKAEFVTNVSHEFRTPMTEILSAVEILSQLQPTDDSARLEFSAIALRGAQRLAGLVDGVLELDAGRSLSMAPIGVAATVRAAVAGLPTEQAGRVRLDLAADLPACSGDAARLAETWARLLDNAFKFSPRESTVDVRARSTENDVVLEFVDRGVGIAAADQQRIFEPFCQVGRDQLIDKATGTGLGLTLAKSTIERHGGRIEVDSQPGLGSTFCVRLPVAAPVCSAVVS